MARLNVVDNILENKVKTFDVNSGKNIESLIREYTDGNAYDSVLVECYDADTGKTFFAPLEDDTENLDVIITVNDKEVDLGYVVKENDEVNVIVTPAHNTSDWNWGSAFAGLGIGALTGALAGLQGGLGGVVAGALIGGVAGFFIGGMVGAYLEELKSKSGTADSGIQGEQLPDVRGATNTPLLGNCLPMVLGKHLTAPFILGSPWNEISGKHGETNYIHALFVVGYAPLRLSDFRLGEILLAHNQSWVKNQNLKNVWHGALHGVDPNASSESDSGEIVNTWASNDVTLEILQQGQNGEAIDYGNVYPYAKVQNDVNANILFIADGSLEDIAAEKQITYKGLGLKDGLRTNRIQFSEQFANTLKVELDFSSGLYKTRSEKSGDNSVVKYYQIPMWIAIQWRPYSEKNKDVSGNESGELEEPTYDSEHNSYGDIRGWHTFDVINADSNSSINSTEFTVYQRNYDLLEHSGNNLTSEAKDSINSNWIGHKAFNLQSLGGTNADQDGISEFRCVTEVDLVQWAHDNLLTSEEQAFTGDDYNEILAKKFRAYFYDASNTTKSIEVRVVRLSPCYINETVSGKKASAYTFNDVFSWKTFTSTMIDGDKLKKDVIEQKRPLPESDMRKLCVVALKAKTDTVDQLSSTIKRFSCIAECFAPYYDNVEKTWFPTDVNSITKYYDPEGNEISKSEYEEDRQNGIKSKCVPSGNDFIPNLVNNVIRTQNHIDEKGRYFIPNDDTLKYCTNNVASMFLLAGIGAHLGIDALSYHQTFYDENHQLTNEFGDFNMQTLAEWHEWAKDVTDGTTYNETGYHYDHDGNRVPHNEGDTVHIYFAANAYIYRPEQLESILAKITVAGRSVYTRDDKNRLTVVIDKEEDYPVALINQQNTLRSSYSISFAETPSGLELEFPDENDGYNQNTIYCMADGEDENDPKKAIEQYKFDYVTNNAQIWSLGRYLLANRILNKEVVVKQIGIEGASISLGNLIVLSDDAMLIGTDNGGRIRQLIEDENDIYGFIINNTYRYTGQTEVVTDNQNNPILDENDEPQYQSIQGVMVMQPTQFKGSRIINLRLALPNTSVTVNGVEYRLVKGNTNIVLFDKKISKNDNSQNGSEIFIYKPELENIVAFGILKITPAIYRVVRIKQDTKRNYEFTLMKYQKELYNYGAELPSFQNNMVIPDRSGEDSYNLSEAPTQADLIQTLVSASTLAQGIVDSEDNDSIGEPDDVTGLTAVARKDSIKVTWDSMDSKGLRNTLSCFVLEIAKGTNVTWESVGEIKDTVYEYVFDRDTDGYLEASTLRTWKFRIKAKNIYGKVSETWEENNVNADNYGTWLLGNPIINARVVDRTINLSLSQPYSSNEIYGNIQYKIFIQRTQRIDGIADWESNTEYDVGDVVFVSSESAYFRCITAHTSGVTFDDTNWSHEEDVDSQNTWFIPAVNANPYKDDNSSNVNNYKGVSESQATDNDYVIRKDSYIQTMPLWGQGSKDIRNTPYNFKVIAFNEAHSSQSTVITAIALCTNIADFVEANATAKSSVVESLSAISADVGIIKQGVMGEIGKNFWALSNLMASQTGLPRDIHEGEFRVGSDDEYIEVKWHAPDNTHPEEYYTVDFKVGNFQVTTTSSNFIGTNYVFSIDKTRRVMITENGFTIQELTQNNDWKSRGFITCDADGNMRITNEPDESKLPSLNSQMPQNSVVYHLDTTLTDIDSLYEDQNNSKNLVFDGTIANIKDADAVQSKRAYEGEIQIPTVTDDFCFWIKRDVNIGEKLVIYNGTTVSTQNDLVKIFNNNASTSWGLTAAQVSANLAKYEE